LILAGAYQMPTAENAAASVPYSDIAIDCEVRIDRLATRIKCVLQAAELFNDSRCL
jgi:hypothetical protein